MGHHQQNLKANKTSQPAWIEEQFEKSCLKRNNWRRDPEKGLQSWFRPAKPETRNPKPTVKVGFELRNPKPETRNRL